MSVVVPKYFEYPIHDLSKIAPNLLARIYSANTYYLPIVDTNSEQIFKPEEEYQHMDNYLQEAKKQLTTRKSDATKKLIVEHLSTEAATTLEVLISRVVYEISQIDADNIASLDALAEIDDLENEFSLTRWILNYVDPAISQIKSVRISKEAEDYIRKQLADVRHLDRIYETIDKFLNIIALHTALDSWDDGRAIKITHRNILAIFLRDRNKDDYFDNFEIIGSIESYIAFKKSATPARSKAAK